VPASGDWLAEAKRGRLGAPREKETPPAMAGVSLRLVGRAAPLRWFQQPALPAWRPSCTLRKQTQDYRSRTGLGVLGSRPAKVGVDDRDDAGSL